MSTIDLKEIKFKELSAAVKALNESGCLEEKILTVGVSKEALVEKFLAAVEGIPDNNKDEWTGPKEAGEYYNKIVVIEEGAVMDDEIGVEIVEEEKEEEPKKDDEIVEQGNKKVVKEKTKKKGQLSEKANFVKDLISKEKYSREEIYDLFIKKFGGTRSSIYTLLIDSHNPKYNRFEKLAITGEDKIVRFEK